MNRGINLIAAAFALTALSYGLARFAYGLLLPQIRADLSFSATTAGWIGSGAFTAYCLGIVFTFVGGRRFSPRAIAMLAGLAATFGMVLVASASSALLLGLGIALAGLSSGLTSPPLASAVAQHFTDQDRPKANGAINAGTAAGIIFSGLAALLAAGTWRELYAVFALIGAGVTAWLWCAIPPSSGYQDHNRFSLAILKQPGLFTLCVSAFLMGLASTTIWTFGADILRENAGYTDSRIAWAWVALGAAGLCGSLTGNFVHRFGIRRVHGVSVGVMACAIASLAWAFAAPAYGFAIMGGFGAAYIVSTGVYLIQGIRLLPERPDLGLGIPFLVLALGQTVGAPLFGTVLDAAGAHSALLMFAIAAGLALVIFPQTGEAQSAPARPDSALDRHP